MPGVPSGRACEACRKQKKKVEVQTYVRSIILLTALVVRRTHTFVLTLSSTQSSLRGLRTAEV
jgi:hypothetical protein